MLRRFVRHRNNLVDRIGNPLILGQPQVRSLMIGRDDSGHVCLWGFGGSEWKLGRWNFARLEFS